ncbi:MAG: GNAT family N-acetyltransferase [Chitinophagales bacterium]|nr:GNAT family N-acetyltransferase [Chitinophagales bacterium]MCZ2393758.1 GNAT family N-acetyltransferase [Chitinophagales bacterium]
MNPSINYNIRLATSEDLKWATEIANEINLSSEQRQTGIALRSPQYIFDKILNGLAVIAIHPTSGEWLGFACLEVWQHQMYVANTCLIVKNKYRGIGVSKLIKTKLFELSRVKFPLSAIFSISANPAVKAVNLELGYKTVSFNEILKDQLFIEGCNSWVNYIDLIQKQSSDSHYSVMVYYPVYKIFDVETQHIANISTKIAAIV